MTPSDKLAAQETRRHFELVARQPDAAIDLAHAALLIAAEEEPGCDVGRWRAQLYELGMRGRERVEREPREPVEALNQYLFGELGFAGNQKDYYDVRNSLLNHVLERRTGIPITLSVVYMEVGRRAGLHTEGVGLPGHFVVRVRESASALRAVLVDPFYGTTVDEDECQNRLDTIYGGQVPLTDEHLRGVTTREILVRMLRNLKAIYTQAQLYKRALASVERILLLAPREAAERRDRGVLLAQLNRLQEALFDLQGYLNTSPRPADAEEVQAQLKRLQIRLAMLN
ncbi:MAG TPA: transglutaminase-like domain-containing protein [Pyrinomonadaceae bacterium]|jgi:regulator of sirC expression with transglutaminase-like and TPR domain